MKRTRVKVKLLKEMARMWPKRSRRDDREAAEERRHRRGGRGCGTMDTRTSGCDGRGVVAKRTGCQNWKLIRHRERVTTRIKMWVDFEIRERRVEGGEDSEVSSQRTDSQQEDGLRETADDKAQEKGGDERY